MSEASTNKDLTNDLTGWSLGEKKIIKDAIASDDYSGAIKILEGLGFQLIVDTPSAAKYLTGSNRKYPALIYSKYGKEYTAEISKFCSNADYKEALGDAIKTVMICFEKEPDGKGKKATYNIKDKQLNIVLNGEYLCHSADTIELKKFLEKSL